MRASIKVDTPEARAFVKESGLAHVRYIDGEGWVERTADWHDRPVNLWRLQSNNRRAGHRGGCGAGGPASGSTMPDLGP